VSKETDGLDYYERVLRDYTDPANDPRRRIAERLCELSQARLECAKCGRVAEKLTIESTLRYLAHGWPRCCGAEMEVHVGPPAEKVA
jgi:hypothetical protein